MVKSGFAVFPLKCLIHEASLAMSQLNLQDVSLPSTQFADFGVCAMAHGQAADYNIVNLDNNTLKMLTGKDVPAFVRFDRDYPYGEKVGFEDGKGSGKIDVPVVHRCTLWVDHNDINQDDTKNKGETNP